MTHQEQLSLELVPVHAALAAAAAAGLHHLPLEHRADSGPLLQENLHQSDPLRGQQQPGPPQQDERQRHPQTAAAAR